MRYFIIWPEAEDAEGHWITGEHARRTDAEHFTRDVGGRVVPQDELETYDEGRMMLADWRAGEDRRALVDLARDLLMGAPGEIAMLASGLENDEDFAGVDDIYCETLIRLRAIVKEAQEIIAPLADDPILAGAMG